MKTSFKSVITDILRETHSKRCNEPATDVLYSMVTFETLMTKLAERRILRNEIAVRILVGEMAQENAIFEHYRDYYIFPTQNDIDNIATLLNPLLLIVTGYTTNSSYHSKVFESCECTFLCEFLSLATRYPIEVIEAFFLPKVFADLQKNFDFILSSVEVDPNDKLHFKLYAKSAELQGRFQRFREQRTVRSNIDGQIVANGAVDFEEADLFICELEGLRQATIPNDLRDLGKDEQCQKLLQMGLERMLENLGYPTQAQKEAYKRETRVKDTICYHRSVVQCFVGRNSKSL